MDGPERTRVKICGVRDAETALVCAHAGVDAVGLVFAPGSARCVTVEEAARVSHTLPAFVTAVGLFVDAGVEVIARAHERCAFGLVQLHGSETPERCEAVHRATGCGVLRAVRFDGATIAGVIAETSEITGVRALLVDGSSGGAGTAFDWSALTPHVRECGVPIVLAGGLTPENVREAVGVVRPFGVDVSSGVESSRGVKDHALIGSFVAEVRRADGTRAPAV